MEGFKGTPGPWVNVGGWVDSDKPGDLSSIICAIYSVTPGNPKAVNDANANLIAAAPELLEALQEVVAAIKITLRVGHDRIIELGGECDSPEVMIKGHSEIARAEAAIAKALGQ